MEVHTTFNATAELLDTLRANLATLTYDPRTWEAISQAGQIGTTVDLVADLKTAAANARAIGAAIERHTAELAALANALAAPAAHCGHCGAAVPNSPRSPSPQRPARRAYERRRLRTHQQPRARRRDRLRPAGDDAGRAPRPALARIR